MLIQFLIILITVFFSVFFTGIEIAYHFSNSLQFELERKSNKFPSKIISTFLNKQEHFSNAMLFGNVISIVFFGMVSSELVKPYIEKYITLEFTYIIFFQILISTALFLILAAFLPKAFFRKNPNITLNRFAILVFLFYIFFYPLSLFANFFLSKISKIFLKSKIENPLINQEYVKDDLNKLINEFNESNNIKNDDEHNFKILKNALEFTEVKIRECVVPRTEIVALSIDSGIEDLHNEFIKTGYSKILIFDTNIDNIVGYVHHSELFKKSFDLGSMIIGIKIVPETMPANKLLSQFIKEKKSIAVVVDEFGGTTGIVTIEDILEEIIGEIEDEHDKPELEEKKINDSEYIFSARLEIDYINEKYNMNLLSKEEYETLGGLILYNYENIPRLNTTIIIDRIKFTVLKVSTTRIELVHLKLI